MVATAPAIASFRSAFMAGGARGFGEAAAGDHLQSVYRLWLLGHQLGRGSAPWRDPYSFQPLTEPQITLSWWPFGLPFWPLDTLFGPVVAWNILLLAGVVAAGLATYGWLRLLDLPCVAALLGGLAFAIAPYRLAQSSEHMLGWIAVFIPVALFAFERSRRTGSTWRAHAWGALSLLALMTIPLSGQVHLAMGAIPFCLVYALVRFRWISTLWLAAGAVAGIAIGLRFHETVISESIQPAGRSLDQVRMFEADWVDLISRFASTGQEAYTYIGWLLPVLAVAGVVLLARRQLLLAVLLALSVLAPLLVALGTNLPTYALLFHHIEPFRYPRVPERLVPIANLALAALAACALAWILSRVGSRWRGVAVAVATLLVLGDLLVLPFRATAADPGNAAYRQLNAEPAGRVVELPLFEPGVHFGSIYQYYSLQAPRQRPGGYSTLAPYAPYAFFWSLNRMNCGVIREGDIPRLHSLGVRYLVFHGGVYRQAVRAGAWFAWQALQEAGFRATSPTGIVRLFALEPEPSLAPQPAPVPEPDRSAPVFCEGWRGWKMKERDAPIWIWGDTNVELELSAPEPSTGSITVDDGRYTTFRVDGSLTLAVPLEGERWHSIVLEIPSLFDTKPPQGFELVRLTYRDAATVRARAG